MRVPFIGSTYETQSPDADVQRTVNWYLEQMETPNGKTQLVLYPTPGSSRWAILPSASASAMLYHRGRLFAAAGTGFYELSSTGLATLRGTITAGTSPATLSTNGDQGGQIFITSGGDGFLYDLETHAFTTVLAGIADSGGFLDGYFLALDATTSTLYISSLNDGLSWDPLDKAQRSTASDPWVGMLISERQVHLFGTNTSESWYNNGDPDFPFVPVQGSLIRDGIAAPYSSVALVDNTRIWLTANTEGTGVLMRCGT